MKAKSIALSVLGIAGAFAFGCLPSARLVAGLYGSSEAVDLGDANPGAANIRRQLGMGAAVLVGALDIGKGWLPVRIARKMDAPDCIAGPIAAAPVAAHIFVVGGKGAAAALGAGFAYDPLVMTVAGAGIAGGSVKWAHAPAVMVGALAYPAVEWLLGRSREQIGWATAILSLVVVGRLKGPRRGAKPVSAGVLWERFWFDREPAD